MKIFPLALLFFCLPAQARECISYSEKTSLSGTLTEQTFAGPPNYQSIAGGDRKESYLFIALSQPICVAPGTDPKEQNERGASNVKIVQLLFPYTDRSAVLLRRQLGKHVSCAGEIWPQQTGHHHSRILFTEAACMVPNNSFNPTAGVGLVINKRLGPAAG